MESGPPGRVTRCQVSAASRPASTAAAVAAQAPVPQAWVWPQLGPLLEHHPGFPERTNVEFVRVEPDGLTVVVWERGCGLTQACGTGACAATAAAVLAGRLAPDTWHRVTLPGGPLSIRVPADLSDVRLRGPVSAVFEGVVPLGPGR